MKKNKLTGILLDFLPHLNIALALVLIVCFVTDRFNRAMSFINNDLTKWVLAIFCVLVIAESILYAGYRRNK